MRLLRRWVHIPARLWWSSLPLRVIALTLVGSVLVLVLGGFVLVRQVSDGVIAAKRQTAVAEASATLQRMQTQLRATDLHTSSLYERLNQLADEAGSQPDQFSVVIQGPVSRYVSPGISDASVPQSLVEAVNAGEGMYVTPTRIVREDQREPSAGLAIGSALQSPERNERYPVYLLFPENHEVETLQVLWQAVASTGALLLLCLAGIAWLVSRQVVAPLREASIAASRIASGRLDERMRVRGTDDLASLATSMNDMAAELARRITQLQELSTVQQRFVSDVSHELRTPLTTVRMAADMLYEGRGELEPFAARSTELMHDELDRFESMLADLLEISRFDAGAAVLSLEETDIVSLVAAEVEAQRTLARSMGCELVLDAVGEEVAQVDGRRITRVVRNLLTNAIEHGEHRPVEITVRGDADCVAVGVRDHGVGFEPHQAGQVFGRFWRADPSRHRVVGGTGLGLAISMEDASLHHGTLRAWGRLGRGANFLLVVPRRQDTPVGAGPLPLVPRGER